MRKKMLRVAGILCLSVVLCISMVGCSGDFLFSILENIYEGWQYLINIFSLVGGNFHLILDNIVRMSGYMVNFFSSFSFPAWIESTILAVLGFGVISKLCHWR